MRTTITTGIAFVLWLCTFLLLVPAGVQLPNAVSLAGIALAIFAPTSWLYSPVLNFVTAYSYWIGVGILLTASGLLVLATGKSKRTARLVVIVDALAIALSIAFGVYVAPPRLG